ncbi:MAG: T9SS type A sorting domain-containing protein [candidate division Zixibacteria bacterium]|nr:T9SS type A sorting domain-containing protein [candidate division Zixibacteria bacterium]
MNRFKILSLSLIFIILYSSLYATIINIPDNYATIQAGIDASTDGDTVLVQPGIYYENINFNGHNIVLGSLFLTTGDTNYIEQTSIGDYYGGTRVTFENGENNIAALVGVRFVNSYDGHSQGIRCINASPIIRSNIIANNHTDHFGAGVYCREGACPLILNNTFSSNSAYYGGAVYCGESNPVIIGNEITLCLANDGGAIYGRESSITISGNKIMNCTAGAILLRNSNAIITLNQVTNTNNAGIYLYQCNGFNVLIKGNTIRENISGITCNDSSPIISNNLIYNNCNSEPGWAAGGIYCRSNSAPIVLNNCIYNNHATYGGHGIVCQFNSHPIAVSNIIRSDTSQLDAIYIYSPSSIDISYSNIQDGYQGEGNIDADPLFRDPDNGDFHLMAIECGDPYDSPCIDMGHPGILDTILNCDWGLGSERSDMGAYSSGELAVDINESIVAVPKTTLIAKNYPNPFNAATSIKYELPYQSHVTIDIYDILGRKVASLVDRQQLAGYHQAVWQADGFSSGMYFYKLQAGDYSETKKMLLLK